MAPPPPPWLPHLQSNISGGDPTTKFAQLATLTSQGRPSVRTVVVREVSATAGLKICTDMRSAKIEGLQACEWAELCWYFTQPRIQFRITGPVHISRSDSMVEEMWKRLSDNAKRSFFAPASGSMKDPKDEQDSDTAIDLNQMPDSFALLLLTPTKVDLVDLVKSQRRIWEFSTELQQWCFSEVHP